MQLLVISSSCFCDDCLFIVVKDRSEVKIFANGISETIANFNGSNYNDLW